MGDEVPGKLLGAGRSADVYDVGGGRVLRRYRDGRDPKRVDAEAQVMGVARTSGVPVPEVYDVAGTDIVMERVTGPTMLDVLARRPWTVSGQARLLARLHELVHQVPAASLPDMVGSLPFGTPAPRETSVLLHRDLHPQNVMLTANGPVIIDWEGALFGPAAADIAMTWIIIGFSDVPLPRFQALATRGVQALFTRAFMRAVGPLDDSWRRLAIEHRLADPHLLPSEAARLEKLAPAR